MSHPVSTEVPDAGARALARLDERTAPAPQTPALLDQLSQRDLRPVQHRVMRTLQERLEQAP